MKRPQVGDRVAVYSGSVYGARGHILKTIGVMAYVRVGRDIVFVPLCDLEVVQSPIPDAADSASSQSESPLQPAARVGSHAAARVLSQDGKPEGVGDGSAFKEGVA